MNGFVIVGGALGLYLFYPLCKSILRKEAVQNPLTYLLWALLDAISAGATFLEHGNYLQALLFCIGGLTVVACSFLAGNAMKWTKFENGVTALVVLCIAIWILTTNVLAALASICALCIASLPQIRDTWNHPRDTPTLIYGGYVVSNLLAALGGKEISIVEVGYALSGLVVCSLIFSFSLRKGAVRLAKG